MDTLAYWATAFATIFIAFTTWRALDSWKNEKKYDEYKDFSTTLLEIRKNISSLAINYKNYIFHSNNSSPEKEKERVLNLIKNDKANIEISFQKLGIQESFLLAKFKEKKLKMFREELQTFYNEVFQFNEKGVFQLNYKTLKFIEESGGRLFKKIEKLIEKFKIDLEK